MTKNQPRLRQATKTAPLYPLNKFHSNFMPSLAKHLCAHLAVRSDSDLEGKDWEKIFADCIGATWSPSNIGLDDITHLGSSTAWGAKTVKGKVPTTAEAMARAKSQTVRLISGRNSPTYSYAESIDPKKSDPAQVGEMVIDIWNARVKEVRAKFANLRTVVLIKGPDLLSVTVFEFDTDMYISSDFIWTWNKNGNLEGHFDSEHKFTWQPHGSQFTIIEEVPSDALKIQIKKPSPISIDSVLQDIGFNNTFYKKL
jgi:hypothetical protein